MSEFIELIGASGRRYRFQRIAEAEHLPAIAGNFAHVRGEGSALRVICLGAAVRLSDAAKAWPQAREQGAEWMFIRRNVSRKVRDEEHADLAAGLDPPIQAVEEA